MSERAEALADYVEMQRQRIAELEVELKHYKEVDRQKTREMINATLTAENNRLSAEVRRLREAIREHRTAMRGDRTSEVLRHYVAADLVLWSVLDDGA